MNPDLIKAYRRARLSTVWSPYVDAGVAVRALDKARTALDKAHEAERLYAAAVRNREALDAAAANGAPVRRDSLQAATTAEHKARTAATDAKARAGLFDSEGAPVVYPPVTLDRESRTASLSDDDGGGAFRNVRDAHDVARLDHTGWFTDPHGGTFRDGTGLCIGVVAQMRGRNGMARYVAGYRFGGVDGGPALDLGEIYESDDGDPWSESSAAIDAARAADSLAERAAEREREYQAAWQAGTMWETGASDVATWKQQAREYIATWKAERRDHGRVAPAFDALVREKVSSLCERIAETRAELRDLRNGDSDPYFFRPGDSEMQAAFTDGAGLTRFPS